MSSNAQLKALFSGWIFPAWLCLALTTQPAQAQAYPPFPAGQGKQAEIWVVEDAQATEAFQANRARVRLMVDRAITNLTCQTSVIAAWRSLIRTNDTVGLKVFSEPGPNSGTRPAVVAAVIEGLLAAGLPAGRMVIWDRHLTDLRLAGFFELGREFGVRLAGSAESGYDEANFYDTPLLGRLVWGDLEFGKKTIGTGRKSFVSKLVSLELTRIINITPLMNHNQVGVCGNLWSLAMGSVDNINRFESDPARLPVAVPDIYNLPSLGDHVVLNIVDALVCQYEGRERSLLHYSVPLNQLRFSRDPVALDVTSIAELNRQRRIAKAPPVAPQSELYNNASSLLELGVGELKDIRIHILH